MPSPEHVGRVPASSGPDGGHWAASGNETAVGGRRTAAKGFRRGVPPQSLGVPIGVARIRGEASTRYAPRRVLVLEACPPALATAPSAAQRLLGRVRSQRIRDGCRGTRSLGMTSIGREEAIPTEHRSLRPEPRRGSGDVEKSLRKWRNRSSTLFIEEIPEGVRDNGLDFSRRPGQQSRPTVVPNMSSISIGTPSRLLSGPAC